DDDLQQTVAVAQVDENDATVIAAAMHPAGDRNLLTDQLFIDLAAIVRTHWKSQTDVERAAMLPGWRDGGHSPFPGKRAAPQGGTTVQVQSIPRELTCRPRFNSRAARGIIRAGMGRTGGKSRRRVE